MSQLKIYVGNLSYNTSEDDLRDYFSQYGTIDDLKIISDRETGRSKGLGFITFATAEECENSLQANGVEFSGRKLNVNPARDSKPRRRD